MTTPERPAPPSSVGPNGPVLVRAGLVCGGHYYDDGLVVVRGTRVAWAGAAAGWPGPLPTPWPAGHTAIAGLVDVHCHGGGGSGFPEADAAGCRTAVAHHRWQGVTAQVASLVSAPRARLVQRLQVLTELIASDDIVGVHLEGPFLSTRRCGAQDPASIVAGDPDLLETMLTAGGGAIRTMTLAPETPRFAELARLLRAFDVVPSIGHTDASAATTTAALRACGAGPVSATHLFNGMAPLHHRNPGCVSACLAAAARGELTVELIADGVHVAAETVAMVFDLVGAEHIALVSDAVAAAGMPDGRYPLGPLHIAVVDGIARVAAPGAPGADAPLAGGTSSLAQVLRHAVTEAGVELVAAVTAATATPARLLGCADRVGDLTPGHRADLLVIDEQVRPVAVMRAGRWLEPVSIPSPMR